ncbi:UbiA prenyltransferase family [Phanerochaete sordida]|uniref:UbiA prenyltransferase family n=1 Tax=Phanerochaete sordida TaxID=48140 RepID=A0A9P3GB06_9APHY|nr:UbiA prenyltransferase family [Phanerochaete sordida]
MSLYSAFSTLAYHAHTLFLFTKDDIKTTFVPIICFTLAAAPIHSISHALHAALWLWLHLLHFDVANQIHAVDEDAINKAHRPLPSKRIEPRAAIRLCWALIPICFGFSSLYSAQVLWASITFAALTFIYNELHIDAGFWLLRNVVNGLGFASFECGTTLLAGRSQEHLDSAAWLAIFHSASILATTIQVQDFKDVTGDARVGRATFPLVSELRARISVFVTVVPWSIVLAYVWKLDLLPALGFTALGVFLGARFLVLRCVEQDRKSYQIYNVRTLSSALYSLRPPDYSMRQVWLSCAHLLVGYWRYKTLGR